MVFIFNMTYKTATGDRCETLFEVVAPALPTQYAVVQKFAKTPDAQGCTRIQARYFGMRAEADVHKEHGAISARKRKRLAQMKNN